MDGGDRSGVVYSGVRRCLSNARALVLVAT